MRQWLRRLREVIDGAMRPAYGSCSGDPISWEQDLLRRMRERQTGGHPDDSWQADDGQLGVTSPKNPPASVPRPRLSTPP